MPAMYDQNGQMYDDYQSQMTMNRASYGEYAGAMMRGAGAVGAGAYSGASNLLSDVGRMVSPAGYAHPARVYTGYYGQYSENPSFFTGLRGQMGLGGVPRGTTMLEHSILSGGDFGERVGGSLAAAGLMTGVSVAANYGVTGAMFQAPFAFAGRSIAQGAGSMLGLGEMASGMMGSVGGFLGGTIAAPLVAMEAASRVIGAVQDRRAIDGALEHQSFRFVGSGSEMVDPRLGTGMNRESRMAVTNMVRQMDIADPNLNTQDLTNILNGSMSLGLMNDSGHTLESFKKRFKDITESVKTVTSVLHTTLEQGLQTIKDLKGIGIDPGQVKQVVQSLDAAGKVAGMTGQEMLGMGLQGAELFRGTGIDMKIGFQANIMNQSAIRAARDAGYISQEAISQAGGEAQMAQMQTAQGLAFSQSGMGRGFGAAFFNPAMAGGFNANSFMNMAAMGGGSFIGMGMTAAGNMASPARLVAYSAHQDRLFNEMGKAFGGQGLEIGQMMVGASMGNYMAGATGASREDAFYQSMKMMGMTETQVDAQVGKIRGRNAIYNSQVESARSTRSKMALEENAQSFFLNRWAGRTGDFFTSIWDAGAAPIHRFVNAAGEAAENWRLDHLAGVSHADVSGVDRSRLITGLLGNQNATLKGLVVPHGLSLNSGSVGDTLMGAINDGAFKGLGITGRSLKYTQNGQASQGIQIGDGAAYARYEITPEQFELLQKRAPILAMSLQTAERVANKSQVEHVSSLMDKALTSHKLDSLDSMQQNDIIQAVFGNGVSQANISQDQMASLLSAAGSNTAVGRRLSNLRKHQTSAEAIGTAVTIEQLNQAHGRITGVRDHIDEILSMGKLNGTVARGVIENISQAEVIAHMSPQELRKHGISHPSALVESLRRSARDSQMATGMAPTDVGVVINATTRVLAAHGGTHAKEAYLASESIQKAQVTDGNRQLSQMMLAASEDKIYDKHPELRAMASRLAGEVATGGMGALTAHESEIRKAYAGSSILPTLTNDIHSARRLKSKIRGVDDFRKILSDVGYDEKTNGDEIKNLVSMYNNQDDRTSVGAPLQQTIMEHLSKKTSLGDKPIGAGGGAGTGDQNQDSAAKNFSLQMNINSATLAAMTGLARKVGINP